MNNINSLFNDKDASLDEILAIIDSYDFDLPSTSKQDLQHDSVGVFDLMEIEDTLMSAPTIRPAAPDNTQHDIQHHHSDATSTPANDNSDKHPPSLVRTAASRQLSLAAAPYKERGRVRDRVIRLRALVKQLEQQLEALDGLKYHGPNDTNSNTVADQAPSTLVSDDSVVTWHQLAIRQLTARREAEKENLSLKERLEEQLRVAKRLENLIRG